ncbi:MAG: NAD(P)-dependent oxidoreductase [Tepidanaerobacteraceae bacterium]|jgi:3-hydroxyisobutyrate dehydrogenase-like beta-hydroxyacid dehydrogenase|nr:NAD(P)-dependent oxidoreductase [Tepidanaerobacteraceae bacterium]
MKIGFIGLGQMGKHMAVNMLKSGAELIVNDVRDDCFIEFEKRGARATKYLKEVAEAEIIFMSLPESKIVLDVLFGENGLARNLRKGQIIVDLSTITYNTTLEIARSLEKQEVDFLDAPVSGMEARAKDGTLTVMCGGKKEVFEKVKPYLEYIGNKILYMGDIGRGQLTKLINQLLFDINVAALAEILPMAVKMGLDPEKVGEVVNSGTGRSYASEFFIPRILTNNFSEGYSLKNAYKDLVSAAEICANLCIPLPVLHAATTTYQMALLKGYGSQDKGAMIRVFEELLSVKYRSQNE